MSITGVCGPVFVPAATWRTSARRSPLQSFPVPDVSRRLRCTTGRCGIVVGCFQMLACQVPCSGPRTCKYAPSARTNNHYRKLCCVDLYVLHMDWPSFESIQLAACGSADVGAFLRCVVWWLWHRAAGQRAMPRRNLVLGNKTGAKASVSGSPAAVCVSSSTRGSRG